MKMQEQSKNMFLTSETLLKYFLTEEEDINTMIMCKDPNTELITTDHALYEALGSVKDDEFNFHKLVKLLEVVEVVSLKKTLRKEKTILTEQRVDTLRKNIRIGGDKNVR
jgi:hypothetical protein